MFDIFDLIISLAIDGAQLINGKVAIGFSGYLL